MSFQIQHYIIEQILGNGRYGKIVIGRHSLVNEKVLIKILEKKNLKYNRDLSSLENEIQLLRQIKHDNIIQLYEILESTYNIYLVFELGQCNLKQKLNHSQKFQEAQSLIYLQQIVKGVMYLHENNIIHCGLRLEKIVLCNGKPKIIGFSDSIKVEKQTEKDYQNIKLQYQSPEMLNLLYYEFNGLKYDVWCLGVILYQMLQGQLPFDNITSNIDLKNKIKKAQFQINYPISQSVTQLLDAMLNRDPDKRISLKDLFNYLQNQNLVFEDEYLKVTKEIPNNIIIKELEELQLDTSQLFVQLEQNKHCTLTACYYLIKNRIFKRAKLNSIKLNLSNFENKKLNNIGMFRNSLQIQNKKSRIYKNGSRIQTEINSEIQSNFSFKPRSLSKTNNAQNNQKQYEITTKLSSTQNSFFPSNIQNQPNKQVNNNNNNNNNNNINNNFQQLKIVCDNYAQQQEKLQQRLKNLLFSNNTSFIIQVSKSKRRSVTMKN